MQLVRHEARRGACLHEDGHAHLTVLAAERVLARVAEGVLGLDVPVSPAEQL